MADSRNPFENPLRTGLLGTSGFNSAGVFAGGRPDVLAEAIADLMRAARQPPTPSQEPTHNALAGLFRPSGSAANVLDPWLTVPQALPSLPPVPSLRQRRVFYSFHFDDVNRVNVVRNSGKIRPIDQERRKTVADQSLWERSRSINEEVLKRSINRALVGTSVTCILVGEHTWSRPWVRYEIARSLLIGNGIFAVRIDCLRCMNQGYGRSGPNPLDYIAVGRDERGRIHVYEHNGHAWQRFDKMQLQLRRWPKWLADVARGYLRPIAAGAMTYHYETERGSDRLLIWANAAAKAAGK